jgi:hypothetical protein
MFSVEEPDRVRDRILEIARADTRVVAGARLDATARTRARRRSSGRPSIAFVAIPRLPVAGQPAGRPFVHTGVRIWGSWPKVQGPLRQRPRTGSRLGNATVGAVPVRTRRPPCRAGALLYRAWAPVAGGILDQRRSRSGPGVSLPASWAEMPGTAVAMTSCLPTFSMSEWLVRSVRKEDLLQALDRAIDALLREAGDARDLASKVDGWLRQL